MATNQKKTNKSANSKKRNPVGQRDDHLSAREIKELNKYFDTITTTSFASINAAYADLKLCDEWN